MRRILALGLVVAATFAPGGAVAAGGAPRITAVDAAGYPEVHVTVVAPTVARKPPGLREAGLSVAGLEAVSLGAAKSIVLAIDRSRSMRGAALEDAVAAGRAFVAAKPAGDRIAVVGFGSRAGLLTGFSTSTIEADAALGSFDVDARSGTALYDAVRASARALAAEPPGGRVVIVLTDGDDVSSRASLAQAIRAARDAKATVYSIAIESPDFSPQPLRELAQATGGAAYGSASTAALAGVYAAIAGELRRTWLISYVTAARPGERVRLSVAAPGAPAGFAELVVPGRSVAVAAEAPSRFMPSFLFDHGGPLAVALAVAACIAGAVAFLLAVPGGTRLRRRLAPHVGGPQDPRAGRGMVEERFATASSVLAATERVLGRFAVWHRLHRMLDRADVPLRTVEFVYIEAGAAFVLGLLVAVTGAGSFPIVLAMVTGSLLPIAAVWWRSRRRLAQIEAQLPDLLITLAASLKAGHSFRQGIQAVVDEGLQPASGEFKRVLTETQLGRPMDDALNEMGERLGSKNIRFVITAVTIQRQVGGSLAGIFDMVADTVRQRQQFALKIKSLTAMGRMSAYVLLGLPFFLAGALTLMNAEYMSPLYTTSTGHQLIIGGVVMMAFGSLILKKIVSFKG